MSLLRRISKKASYNSRRKYFNPQHNLWNADSITIKEYEINKLNASNQSNKPNANTTETAKNFKEDTIGDTATIVGSQTEEGERALDFIYAVYRQFDMEILYSPMSSNISLKKSLLKKLTPEEYTDNFFSTQSQWDIAEIFDSELVYLKSQFGIRDHSAYSDI
jgi:hypothetical protein